MEPNRAMEFGRAPMESHILASGKAAKLTDMESMSGSTVTATKESGDLASDMETVPTFSQMEICTLDNTRTENLKDMVSTNGSMATHTKEHSKMVLSMAMVNGRKSLRLKEAAPTIMKVITIWIRKMAGDFSNGRVATLIVVVMSMMREKVLVKCAGPMAPSTEVLGTKVCSMASESCSFLTVIAEAASLNRMFSE